MTRLILILFLIYNSANGYCQNFDKIKNSDTVYVYFKKSNAQLHYKEKTNNVNQEYDNYFFLLNCTPHGSLQFAHHYSFSPGVKYEKKSFLKKNKDLIATYEFLNLLSMEKINELLNNFKQVYIIDEEDFNNRKIKLKKIKVLGNVPNIEE